MERTIKVGEHEFNVRMKLGVFDHLNEICGTDAITFITNQAANNLVFGCYALLLAGIRCYQDKHNGAPVEADHIMKVVRDDADIETFNELINIYGKFMNPGEAKAQETVNPSPGPLVKNSPSEVLE